MGGFVLTVTRNKLRLIQRLLILEKDKKFISDLLSEIDAQLPSKKPYMERPLWYIFYRNACSYLYYAFRINVIKQLFFLSYYSKYKGY